MLEISRWLRPGLLLLLLAGSWPALGQAQDQRECADFADVTIPAADQPTANDRRRLAGCVSESFYYAEKSGQSELRDARLCAFLERETEEPPVFGGPAVLMMVYANGRGVPANLDLARRFACEVSGASAELDGRLKHLAAMAAGKEGSGTPFDLCDDITSGYMAGFCAKREAEALRAQRELEITKLISGWPPAKREALAALRLVANEYFDTVVSNEVDLSGTARAAMQVDAQETLEQEFFEFLQGLEAGRYPQGDAAALARADAELNRVYAKVMKAAKPENRESDWSFYGTVQGEGIRKTERSWLRYRDAWARFGKASYPKVAPEAWLLWQTNERIAQLSDFPQE